MTTEAELDDRLAELRTWAPRTSSSSWEAQRAVIEDRPGEAPSRRRALLVAAALVVCIAATVGWSLRSDGDDASVLVDQPSTTTGPATTAGPTATTAPETITAPAVSPGAFSDLESGWHELDTGLVPPGKSTITWTGEELVVAVERQLFGYRPDQGSWRAFPDSPFREFADLSMVWMESALLVVDENRDAATLDLATGTWTALDAAPDGIPEYGGPRDPNQNVSLVWTGDRAINGTHGAVFDPDTNTWDVLPLPEDIVGYAHLLYSNPVWTGDEFVLAYPHDAPGLVFDALGSRFEIIDGIDRGQIELPVAVDWALSGLVGDRVVYVREDLSVAYDPSTDTWTPLPVLDSIETSEGCPGHAATLGTSFVVAPCHGQPPIRLLDSVWKPTDPALTPTGCCRGEWLGIDGVLLIWDSIDDVSNSSYVRALIWVP